MNPRRKSRLYLAMVVVFGAAVTLALTLYALRANIDLFYTPSEILGGKGEDHQLPHVGQRLRIGGMVMPGSVKRDPQTLQVTFKIYDAAGAVAVSYVGILPDLFREGQGVVAQGILAPGNRVEAREVLAKHDEKYTPPEVASAMSPARRPAALLTAAAPPAARDASGAPLRSPAQSGEQP
ncbi:Cytochrome c biogenesis protein [Sodalis praecaptivus]|uniref:Cytochrome c-type biogenesis protein CcmE n=1 Tax=Sodalis praecaptivus TaxID=1239307 RepID=W0HR82_9GAMM|nr:cytochrome c maturation protein CcmE [Sodalis praecaptivus]AHF76351.1 Cytochrome c biogenesis protein [Sodalis praecaptivus]